MQLIELKIRRFRNLEAIDWTPGPGISLIHGENAQGKTNLLEAIYFSLLGRSFRTRREHECLPWGNRTAAGEESTRVETKYRGPRGEHVRRLSLGRDFKTVYADGAQVDRLAELWRSCAVVTFSPADVDLFRGSPAGRRRLLDQALSLASPAYLEHLQRYQRALRQTNATLKNGFAGGAGAAEAFYPLLASDGAALMAMRGAHLTRLRAGLESMHCELGGEQELKLRYDPSLKGGEPQADDEATLAEAIARRLEQTHQESLRLGALAVGPHRDDFKAMLGGRDLGRFGSQGQQRLAALALKLASAEQLGQGLEDPPLLLLDDFGSELDLARRLAVVARLHGRMQTFITATKAEDLGPAEMFDEVRELHAGSWVT